MKTDKLFYRIFLSEPSLIAELLSDIPDGCEFEYSAPVVKEKEIRLDGLLIPIGDRPDLPIIFLEAQMQKDSEFYSRYFAGLFVYLHQYKAKRIWRGLLILNAHNQDLGSESPYQALLNTQVQRLYLEDLLTQENLSPNLALLKLIVTPETEALNQAKQILNSAETEAEFRLKLDLIEAILVNKFPKLTIEEVQKMLNLREADVTQTRFYQEVLQIGRLEGEQQGMQEGIQQGMQQGMQEGMQQGMQEGMHQGEANIVIRLLNRRCGSLTSDQIMKVQSLSLDQLDTLGDALLDFKHLPDLENWFSSNIIEL
jgi:predicted transposase/invertase (TIGR01784 family)